MPRLKRIRDELVKPFNAPEPRRCDLTATVELAVDFYTWRLLVRRRRLSRRAAIQLMSRLVIAAAHDGG